MKKFVICHSGSNNNQFLDEFEQAIEVGGYKIYTHSEPKFTVGVTQREGDDIDVNHNFDHYIVSYLSYQHLGALSTGEITQSLEPHQYTQLIRYGKTDQQIMLSRARRDYIRTTVDTSMNMVAPSAFFADRKIRISHAPDVMKIVAKPEFGARSMAHLLINANKEHVGTVLTKLKNKIIDKNNREEAVEEVLNEEGGLEAVNSGFEHVQGEGLKALDQPMHLTRYVPNVKSEYRLIVVNGEVVYVQERVRSGDVYKTATGAGCYSKKVSTLTDVCKSNIDEIGNTGESVKVLREIEIILRLLKQPIISVDLFFTENNQWGIFEFSPEFGNEGISQDWRRHILDTFIRFIIEKTIKASDL